MKTLKTFESVTQKKYKAITRSEYYKIMKNTHYETFNEQEIELLISLFSITELHLVDFFKYDESSKQWTSSVQIINSKTPIKIEDLVKVLQCSQVSIYLWATANRLSGSLKVYKIVDDYYLAEFNNVSFICDEFEELEQIVSDMKKLIYGIMIDKNYNKQNESVNKQDWYECSLKKFKEFRDIRGFAAFTDDEIETLVDFVEKNVKGIKRSEDKRTYRQSMWFYSLNNEGIWILLHPDTSKEYECQAVKMFFCGWDILDIEKLSDDYFAIKSLDSIEKYFIADEFIGLMNFLEQTYP